MTYHSEMQRFDIRAERAGGGFLDFYVRTVGLLAARKSAEEWLGKLYPELTRYDWRGLVVFLS